MRYVPFLLAMACGMLWIAISFPIARLLRVDLRRQKPALRGMLSWGIGMFVCSVVDDYLRWKLTHLTALRPSVTDIVFYLSLWLAGGAFFGRAVWSHTQE